MNPKSDGNSIEFKSDSINIQILPFWAVSPPLPKDLEGLGGLQRVLEGLRGPLKASEGLRGSWEPQRASGSLGGPQ